MSCTPEAIPFTLTNSSMTTHQINNVVDPTLAQDAATKNYVDTHSSGITGTGSPNYVPLWNSTSTLTSSHLFDSGTNFDVVDSSLVQHFRVTLANGNVAAGAITDNGNRVFSVPGTGLTGSGATVSLNINSGTTQTCGAGTFVSALSSTGITTCTCGLSATVVGNNNGFIITTGSGATACTATFSHAFTTGSVCSVTSNDNSIGTLYLSSSSNSAITIAHNGTGFAGDKLYVVCWGY